jgi:hypothetical protein
VGERGEGGGRGGVIFIYLIYNIIFSNNIRHLLRFSAEATNELRPKTDVKNLYLTGQDIFNCGIVGSAFGGLLCASEVLNRNVYADLVALKKRSRPSIVKE